MKILEKYIECMKNGDQVALADLFEGDGSLHDTSLPRIGKDVLHLKGKMAIEMMFHHKFGFNGGPFPIYGVVYKSDEMVWYFIQYGDAIVPVNAFLTEVGESGKIRRLDVFPL